MLLVLRCTASVCITFCAFLKAAVLYFIALSQNKRISFIGFLVSGQDYNAIEAFAKSIKYSEDVTKLTDKISAPYQDEESKVRAIFVWVAS